MTPLVGNPAGSGHLRPGRGNPRLLRSIVPGEGCYSVRVERNGEVEMNHCSSSRVAVLALAALAIAGLAQAGAAQEPEASECSCVRAPRVSVRAPMVFFGNGSHRGRMGISVGASQDDQEYDGALVLSVVEDGPADDAGIREGDVITAVRGQSLLEPLPDIEDEERLDLDASVPVQRLLSLSRQLEPGETVTVTYLRDGNEDTTELVAEDLGRGFRVIGGSGGAFGWDRDDRDGDDFQREFHFEMPNIQIPNVERLQGLAPLMGAWGGLHGLRLTSLNPALGEYFGAEEGILVLDVDEDSPLGLQAGDVLLDIGGRAVRDESHAWRILGSYESGEAVSFRVVRQGNEQTVEGELPRRRSRRREVRY